jgi:hypothetical protein
MSSNKSADRPITEPLILEPQSSRLLAAGLMVLHLGAVPIIFLLNGLIWPGKLFLLGLVAVSGVYYWRRVIHAQQPNTVKRLTWRADGEWLLELVSGEKLEAELLPNAYVHAWLVTLIFRRQASGEKIRLVLFRDALEAEMFRRLRVRLRLEAGPAAAGGTG